MADDAKREAFKSWLDDKFPGFEPTGMEYRAQTFHAGYDAGAAHEREKYARLVAAAIELLDDDYWQGKPVLPVKKYQELESAVAEIGGDDA